MQGEGVRPFLFFFLSLLIVFPSNAEAAEIKGIDTYYYLKLESDGYSNFYNSSGPGTLYFPENVTHISVAKSPNSTRAVMTCTTGAGETKTIKFGVVGFSLETPSNSVKCVGESKDGLNNMYGAVTGATGVSGTKYSLQQPPSTGTPPEGGGNDGGNNSKVDYNAYYVPYRDAYRMDYKPPSGAASYKLKFTTASGTVHYRDYDYPPTGIHYLTCNGGSYELEFYDSSGKMISRTQPPYTTSQIQNPSCASFSDTTGFDDLSARYQNGGISWNDIGADSYEVYKDGQLLDTLYGTDYPVNGDGSYSIVAKDAGGQIVGQSDINVGSSTGGETGGGDGCGDVCDQIAQLLQCPGWGDILNDLEGIMPKPPDWDEVAGIFTDHIVPEMGQEIVNRAPEIAEIIADEFQSREKPVSPPPALPDFKPDVPTLEDKDMPGVINESLDTNVPEFKPDFSESQSFSIPDPMDLTYDNTDGGYDYPTNYNPTAPSYTGKEKEPTPSPDYKPPQGNVKPPPDYNRPDPGGSPPPGYNPPSGGGGSIPEYEKPQDGKKPDYDMEQMPFPGYKPDLGG